MKITDKTVNLELIGLDSNAFALMGAFRRQARRDGWTNEEITAVLDEAMKDDYNHLLCTLNDYCESKESDDDDDADWIDDEHLHNDDDWEDDDD